MSRQVLAKIMEVDGAVSVLLLEWSPRDVVTRRAYCHEAYLGIHPPHNPVAPLTGMILTADVCGRSFG